MNRLVKLLAGFQLKDQVFKLPLSISLRQFGIIKRNFKTLIVIIGLNPIIQTPLLLDSRFRGNDRTQKGVMINGFNKKL